MRREAVAPIRCGRPWMPVAASASKSGSVLRKWAATPREAAVTTIHAGGPTGGSLARDTTAGSDPNATAYGSHDRGVALKYRL